MKVIRCEGKFTVLLKSLTIFLILFHSTKCETDEADRARAVQKAGQELAEVKDENVQNAIITRDAETSGADTNEAVVPIVANTAPEQTADHEEVVPTEEPIKSTDPDETVTLEKQRIDLLPEQQSDVYGKQIAHVPGNRPNQSPMGGLASMFGGFHRAITGGAVSNLAAANGGKGVDPEVDRAQKLKSGFEKMIQMVNILGQVDSFLSDRTRSVMRRLSMLADANGDDERYRRSHHHRHHY